MTVGGNGDSILTGKPHGEDLRLRPRIGPRDGDGIKGLRGVVGQLKRDAAFLVVQKAGQAGRILPRGGGAGEQGEGDEVSHKQQVAAIFPLSIRLWRIKWRSQARVTHSRAFLVLGNLMRRGLLHDAALHPSQPIPELESR